MQPQINDMERALVKPGLSQTRVFETLYRGLELIGVVDNNEMNLARWSPAYRLKGNHQLISCDKSGN